MFAYTAAMPVKLTVLCRLLLPSLLLSSTAAHCIEEKFNTGWRFNLDNDLLANADRDYTGGIALTLSGRRAQQYWFSLEGVRNGLDALLHIDKLYAAETYFRLHSVQYGAMLFTPGDITTPAPVFDDRPYASLFYLSNTELTVIPARNQALMSTLTFGFLGLNAAEYIQKAIHAITDSDVANGWSNQISAGGEPTLMYTLSRQHNTVDTRNSTQRHQLKIAYEANAGFSTDVNASLSWRWGRIATPWWSFNPQHAQYIQLGAPLVARTRPEDRRERFVWAGVTLKYRFYSSLLQGQFRESVVTLNSSELKKLLAQIWLGATWEFADNIRASVFYRASSKEFKGPNAHFPVWAGLVVSRAY